MRLYNSAGAAAISTTLTQYAADSQTSTLPASPAGTEACNGSGIVNLTAGTNTVSLTSIPTGGDATINVSLSLMRLS